MRKKLIQMLAAVALVFNLNLALVPVVGAVPVDVFPKSCTDNSQVCSGFKNTSLFGPGSVWSKIINAFIYVIGAISGLMILIGAFRYVVSGGEAASVTAAKNTILYSVVGLVVAAMSFTIVNFILIRL
jgi:hypothetical protein